MYMFKIKNEAHDNMKSLKRCISTQELDYLEKKSLLIEIHGRQSPSASGRRGSHMDAYTITDHRRASIFSSGSGASSSASFLNPAYITSASTSSTGSYVASAHLSASNVIVEDPDEPEEEAASSDSDSGSLNIPTLCFMRTEGNC